MSVCGEVTNNIEFLKLLISYGFDDFSVSYSNFLSIKNSVLNLNFKTLVAEYKKSLGTENILAGCGGQSHAVITRID